MARAWAFYAQRGHRVIGGELAQLALAQAVATASPRGADVPALLARRKASGGQRRAHVGEFAIRECHRTHARVAHVPGSGEPTTSTRHVAVPLHAALERLAI